MKNLAVFDFDHTIIKENTDTAVAALIPGGIPSKLKELHKKDGWTAFMQGVFDILHNKHITEDQITDIIVKLEPVEGMPKLISELSNELNYDVIIISDSNSIFINSWLSSHDLKDSVLKVFTNPAEYVDGGLKIKMYHLQDYCDLSTKNLCKGRILLDFVESQKENGISYSRVIYSGDGWNDLCPILKLNSLDFAFVREKYKCAGLVEKVKNGEMKSASGEVLSIKAAVHTWKSGYDILEVIRNIAD